MKPWAPNYSRFIADCPACAGNGGEWDADEDGRCWIPCYVCDQRGTMKTRKQVLQGFREARNLRHGHDIALELRELLPLFPKPEKQRKAA